MVVEGRATQPWVGPSAGVRSYAVALFLLLAVHVDLAAHRKTP